MSCRLYAWKPYLNVIVQEFPENEFTTCQVRDKCGEDVAKQIRKMSTRGLISKSSKKVGNIQIWSVSQKIVNDLKGCEIKYVMRRSQTTPQHFPKDFYGGEFSG